ncbi:MAG: DEAD/DEAH box helicase [Myxococcales bacterium]|nr:DEAD/DEAH box helicase [Myxococcales bacterium]
MTQPAGVSFAALALDPRVLAAIVDAGYTTPTPVQLAAIPAVLAGQDVVGIAQTGTGKTAAFMLPILTKLAALPADAPRGTKVLVLAPTRELAAQIEENVRIYAKHLQVRVASIFGGVGENPQINALRAGYEVIVACPGRLIDLMDRRNGNFAGLQYLVLDEADRMLDMGFLPSIKRIVGAMPRTRQTLMFSATLSREIEGLTREFQRAPKKIEIGRRADPAATVTQKIYEVPQHLKLALLAHLLREESAPEGEAGGTGDDGDEAAVSADGRFDQAELEMDSVLIFCRTRHGADRVAKRLEQMQIRTGVLHSDRTQPQRMRALADFKCGAVRALVATDIAARGIDVNGISHVVNYDFPPLSDDYVHRIGRTGRALATGDAISFVTETDRDALRLLERTLGHAIPRARAEGFDYAALPAPGAVPARQNLNMPAAKKGGGPTTHGGRLAAWTDPANKHKKKDWRHK